MIGTTKIFLECQHSCYLLNDLSPAFSGFSIDLIYLFDENVLLKPSSKLPSLLLPANNFASKIID